MSVLVCICLYLSERGQDVCICLYLSIFVREGARSMLIKHWPALGAPRPHFLSQTLSPLFPRPSRRIQQSALHEDHGDEDDDDLSDEDGNDDSSIKENATKWLRHEA